MSHAIAFDTFFSVKRLKEAGFTDAQAETQTRIIAELVDDRLATKKDLEELRLANKQDLKELELRIAAELASLKWGMAVTVGGIMAIVLKSFVPH
ncbi:MAG: CCDC90 family protein [Magnetococcus sp. YQC-5]